MAFAKPTPEEPPPEGGLRAKLAKYDLGKYWYPKEFLLAAAFLVALGVGGVWGTWENLCAGDECPSIAQVRILEHEQTSKVYAVDGRQIAELGLERRTPVSIHAVPPYVSQAVVAIEDQRFYDHHGFDPLGMARAAYGVITFRNLGGGSTITQQLARNMFDQIGFDRQGLALYVRKFKEIQVALDLERAYTKDQILEYYLNEIWMGRGYGFQNAARSYFGKNLADVNVAEAALLAAILNRPATYDPFRYPERAKQRRDLALRLMADQGYLTEGEAESWQRFPLPETEPTGEVNEIAPYFTEWVRQILDDRYGSEVYTGGLRVYTTLDVGMQQAARAAMEEGWAAVEADTVNFLHPRYAEFDTIPEFPQETPYLQGAFVALDPITGQVKAMIGGRDFNQSKFDRARLAQRQAGSSFKPFVYTSAVASGLPASHIIVDGPFVTPQLTGPDWRPENFTQDFVGPLTMREGLYTSRNLIAIHLGWDEVGIQTVLQTARRMGISSAIPPVPSTLIGAAEVRPIEMAEAYSAFATLGTKVEPIPIARVEDADGNLIWEPQPERTVVVDSLVARIMVSMLEDVVIRGTGYNAIRNVAGLPREVAAAGKTGTTNDGVDVWFNGFTPNLLAVAWFGMDTPQPIFELGPAYRAATGAAIPAPVWGSFMRRVYYGVEGDEEAGIEPMDPLLPIPGPWEPHPGLNPVLVDRVTGNLASRWCPVEDQYVEYYIPGTEPTELCDRSNRRFQLPRFR